MHAVAKETQATNKTKTAAASKTRAPMTGSDHSNCPIRDLLSRIGDKWSMLVIMALAQAPDHCLRFSQLMQNVNGISQRMLTTTVRYLERDGIVGRELYGEVPPRVEYTLTPRGQELLVPVTALVNWISAEWPGIEKSRRAYDRKSRLTVKI